MAAATAIIGSAAIAGGANIAGSVIQSNATKKAANTQAESAAASIRAQERMANKGFDVFSRETQRARTFLEKQNALALKELRPYNKLGLEALTAATGYLKPGGALEESERAQFQKTLAQNLSARGLTGSGTEIAGLTDFELGLAQQRRSLAQGLAGLGGGFANSAAGLRTQLGQGLSSLYSNLGQGGASIYGNLGQGIGSTLAQSGANIANLQLAQGQAIAQGVVGASNAIQGGALGYMNIQQGRQNQQFQSQLLAQLLGGAG